MNLIEEGSMLEMQKARTPGQKLPTRRERTGLGEEMVHNLKVHKLDSRNKSGNDKRRTSEIHDFESC